MLFQNNLKDKISHVTVEKIKLTTHDFDDIGEKDDYDDLNQTDIHLLFFPNFVLAGKPGGETARVRPPNHGL